MRVDRAERPVKVQYQGPVTLTMSEYEASVLSAVLWSVGGNPIGPRGVCKDLLQLLESVGVPRYGDRTNIDGSVYFK